MGFGASHATPKLFYLGPRQRKVARFSNHGEHSNSETKHSNTETKQPQLAAPDIKIPAYAFNVSYNARHDTPERLRSTLGITEEIPLEILDSPLDNPEEAYRVPHKIVVIRNVGG